MKKLLILLGAMALTFTLATAEGKCGTSEKGMMNNDGKCGTSQKSMMNNDGKCGNTTKPQKCDSGKKKAPEKGKCGKGKCGQ